MVTTAVLMLRLFETIPNVISIVDVQPVAEHESMPAHTPYWVLRANEIEVLAANLNDQRLKISNEKAQLAAMQARVKSEQDELMKMRSNIEQYQAQLDAAEAQLAQAKEDFLKEIVQIEQIEMKNLKTLANTYAALSPDAILSIFKEMDDLLVVKILAQMKPETVASIFEEMVKASSKKDPQAENLAKKVSTLSEKLRLVKQPQK